MPGFEVIDGRYRQLFDRASDVLGHDPRVLEVKVGGSVAAGTADHWSDLDIHIAARSDSYDEFIADWPQWISRITSTVFARTPIWPFIINTTTAEGLTVDFVIYRDEIPSSYARPRGYSVGLLARQPFPTLAQALDYAVAERMRGLAGPFITFVKRGEHLALLTGVPHEFGLLTTVLLAENDAEPPTLKHFNASFTDEQQAAIGALPPLIATVEGVPAWSLAVAELTISRARPLFTRYQIKWPTQLAVVAADRLRDTLGINTAAWLY